MCKCKKLKQPLAQTDYMSLWQPGCTQMREIQDVEFLAERPISFSVFASAAAVAAA